MRVTIYEQPLNERIRSFLRLEYLFRRCDKFMAGKTAWDSRAAIETLIEINNLVGRSDLKTEILKELERHTKSLTGLFENPKVDHKRLDHVLLALDALSGKIFSDNQPFGYELKQNEFISPIRQRASVPGGTCEMDLPGFHYWLQKPDEERMELITGWFSCFETLRQAIELILRLIRDSTVPKLEFAEKGFFQRSLEAKNPGQLLRIGLPVDTRYYPEISAGKHRFSVRFLYQADELSRPAQVDNDLEFEISYCTI